MLRFGRASGLLVMAGPTLFMASAALSNQPRWSAESPAYLATLVSSALITAGGALLLDTRLAGRVLATLGMAGWAWGLRGPLLERPSLAVFCLLGLILLLHRMWGRTDAENVGRSRLPRIQPRLLNARVRLHWAAWSFTVFWAFVLLWRDAAGPWLMAAVLAEGAIYLAAVVDWLRLEQRKLSMVRAAVMHAGWISAMGCVLSWEHPRWMVTWYAPVVLVGLLVPLDEPSAANSPLTLWDLLLQQPARLLVGTFALLCAVGTVFLALPACGSGGASVGILDAAFTATSAVCVTGLIVLDTPAAFTLMGQIVILVLIQLGGLGIMTFSTAALALLGQRVSLRHETAMVGIISGEGHHSLYQDILRLLKLTFVAEALGAITLSLLFLGRGDGVAMAIWRGLFTSISAFCNAGFALQTDSLIPYAEDPLILNIVAALIVLGGLSPAGVAAIPLWIRRKRVPLQSKLAVAVTALLLLFGTVIFLGLESTTTMRDLNAWDRLNNAWFQSVTLRTAGFNSIDLSALHPVTFMLAVIWMFIGGSPGGTAGGVKTTTVGLLTLAAAGVIRGRWEAEAFGRKIPHRNVYKAAAVFMVGLLLVLAGFFALETVQPIPPGMALFEVVSALATVGLTVGATPLLDEIGKIIIIGCMFVGRVGPLTIFLLLQDRQAGNLWTLPEENVETG